MIERASDIIRRYVETGGCDLHLHTHFSDGADSVVSLVQKVMANRLKCFAVTDHDSIDAVPEIFSLLDRLGELGFDRPAFIPGIEISAEYDFAGQSTEIHILGYFPSGGYEEMSSFVQEQRKKRDERNSEMCRRLTEMGMPVTMEEMKAEGRRSVGRLHAANILMRKGYLSSVKEGFDTLFGYGKPCYVRRDKPGAKEAVRNIKDAGGMAVIAHPYLYKWTGSEPGRVSCILAKAIDDLKHMGIEGVEAFHGEASQEQREETYAVSLALGLLPTAGSDYHGENKSGVRMYDGETHFIEDDTCSESALLLEKEDRYLVCSDIKTDSIERQIHFPLAGSHGEILEKKPQLIVYGRVDGARRILSLYKASVPDKLKQEHIYLSLQELGHANMPLLHSKAASILREITLFSV